LKTFQSLADTNDAEYKDCYWFLSTAVHLWLKSFLDRTWRHSQQESRLIRHTIIYSIAVLEDKQSYVEYPYMDYYSIFS